MKTRLLMLLSVFMAITSVGWMQAQSITYYKTGSGSGGTGTEQDPIVKISLDEILGDANAKTESDSIVVSLSNGDYCSSRISVQLVFYWAFFLSYLLLSTPSLVISNRLSLHPSHTRYRHKD